MKLLAHRGLWQLPEEQNQPVAFARAFAAGFGIETDLRDRLGRLVIAHDPAGPDALDLAGLLAIPGINQHCVALNIKADGLAPALQAALSGHWLDWFSFDMSVPELRRQIHAGMTVFTRASEWEDAPCLEEAGGVWLDGFADVWYDAALIARYLAAGKRVCVVSPELHGRPAEPLWAMLADAGLHSHPAMLLCTDRPDAAQRFFSNIQ